MKSIIFILNIVLIITISAIMDTKSNKKVDIPIGTIEPLRFARNVDKQGDSLRLFSIVMWLFQRLRRKKSGL
jgi:hypothetical protein